MSDKIEINDFFTENQILTTLIGTILASNITLLTKSFMDNIVLPIINMDLNNDGEPDRETLEKFELNFSGINMKIGKFILTTIEFSIILFIIYIVNNISKNI